MNKPTITILVFLLVITLLTVYRVYAITSLTEGNVEYAEILKRTRYFKAQNVLIRDKILYYSSFSYLENTARTQGYIPLTQTYRIR